MQTAVANFCPSPNHPRAHHNIDDEFKPTIATATRKTQAPTTTITMWLKWISKWTQFALPNQPVQLPWCLIIRSNYACGFLPNQDATNALMISCAASSPMAPTKKTHRSEVSQVVTERNVRSASNDPLMSLKLLSCCGFQWLFGCLPMFIWVFTSQDYPSPLSPLTVNRNRASRTILITLSCPSFAMIIHHCRNFVRNFTSGPRACGKFINFHQEKLVVLVFFSIQRCASQKDVGLRWRGSNTSLQIAKPWRYHSITIGIHWYHFKMLSYEKKHRKLVLEIMKSAHLWVFFHPNTFETVSVHCHQPKTPYNFCIIQSHRLGGRPSILTRFPMLGEYGVYE